MQVCSPRGLYRAGLATQSLSRATNTSISYTGEVFCQIFKFERSGLSSWLDHKTKPSPNMHDQNITSGLVPMDASNICSPGTLAWSNAASSDQPRDSADAQVKILTRSLSNRHVVVWNHDASVLVLQATDADVLGGRGKHLDQHPGNIRLTEVAELFKTDHHHGTSIQKREVIDKILTMMLREGRRFLKLVPYQHDANIWHWEQETMHRAKISQKLRDAYRVWTKKCFGRAGEPDLALRPRMPSSRTSSSSSSATSVHVDSSNSAVCIEGTNKRQLGKGGADPAHLVTPWGDAIIMCNPHQIDTGDEELTVPINRMSQGGSETQVPPIQDQPNPDRTELFDLSRFESLRVDSEGETNHESRGNKYCSELYNTLVDRSRETGQLGDSSPPRSYNADPSSRGDKEWIQSETSNSVNGALQHPCRDLSIVDRSPNLHEDKPTTHDAECSSMEVDGCLNFAVLRERRKDHSLHHTGVQNQESSPRARRPQEAGDYSSTKKTPCLRDKKEILQIEPIDVFTAGGEISSISTEADSSLDMLILANEQNNGDDVSLDLARSSIPETRLRQDISSSSKTIPTCHVGDEDAMLQVEPINIFETANEADRENNGTVDCQDLLFFIPCEHLDDE